MDIVREKFDGNLVIPENFTQTVAPYDRNSRRDSACGMQPQAQINPQTMSFCDRLSIDDPMSLLLNASIDSTSDSSQVRNIYLYFVQILI